MSLRNLQLLAVACLLAVSAPASRAEPDRELEKARLRVRDLEEEIVEVIREAAPAVGAVVNHGTLLNPATGAVSMRPRSLGSGVVITRGGFFLTNVHVIEGAGYLTVTLPDGVTYPADRHADTTGGRVKGDIAVLKLRGKRRFPHADWRDGDPKRLEPGSFVFAMGNPHGHALDGTPVVTLGVLSAKGRAAADRRYLYVGALQTDAEINPGNSGGPLFDSKGRLIGINGLMQSRAGRSNSGVGYAIPIDQVRLFLRRMLRSEGETGYGFHGLRVETAEGERGARVTKVENGSPAKEAGLRRGDVVTRVNGKRIANRADYLNHAARLPESSVVRLRYVRGRKRRGAHYRLVPYEEYLESMGRGGRPADRPYPPHERGYLGAQWSVQRGAVVLTRVLTGTGAEEAKLQPGDVVVSVDGHAVGGDPKALVAALARRPAGAEAEVEHERGGERRTVTVVLCDARDAAEIDE